MRDIVEKEISLKQGEYDRNYNKERGVIVGQHVTINEGSLSKIAEKKMSWQSG